MLVLVMAVVIRCGDDSDGRSGSDIGVVTLIERNQRMTHGL